MKRLSAQEEKEHEAFKNRLVDEVLGQDSGDKVPMEKVVMLLWQFRSDPTVVTFMARFVAKYAGSRDVFDGIEFYLPQLAHMIIHLEVDWDDAILERFALVIAQQSVHFALQLNWILQGALQDYQPECYDEDGARPNPNYNPVFYLRCLKLLKNVERCVVYGKPRAQELHRLYEKGKITKSELAILEQADRRFNALQITAADDSMAPTERLDGWLYFTPPHKAPSAEAPKPKPAYRFLVLERQVLNVYTSKGGCSSKLKLARAMSIEKSTVESLDVHSIHVSTPKYSFGIKCGTPEEKNLWMRRLQEEATVASLFQSHMAFAPPPSTMTKSVEEAESEHLAATDQLKSDLTEAQRNRYEFFQAERVFVDNLTNIAEELRFKERAERKTLAPKKMEKLSIPPSVYLPLCNSSDIWRRVADKLADETRVFNTKERCPVVMHFVSKRGETSDAGFMHPNMDVAEYMHNHFDVVAETEVIELNESDDEAQTSPAGESSNHMRQTRTPSNVWEDDHPDDEDGLGGPDDSANAAATSLTSPKGTTRLRGNQKVQRLLRESVVTLPNMLAKRLNPTSSKKRIVSVMDRQTEMQPMVVILEGNMATRVGTSGVAAPSSADNPDDGSVVSVEKSSVLYRDQILMGQMDEGDIDMESIQRATAVISGGESWAQKSAKMLEHARKKSEALGEKCQLEISSCLAKSNDDLRQEVFVMQMIHYYKSVFAQAKLPIWLKTYRILSTSSSTGLLELLTDATSLDALKKSPGYPAEGGLRKYFEITYGGSESKAFKAAQTNFVQSLAGYALVSYLLGLKDRHNGNIMIDTRGHLIFIDFGFAMGMKPGHEFSFERAPFKLTKEYVEVMDGVGSECYKEFERLFVSGFEECRRNSQIALGLVEIMMYKSNYPCFSGWRYGKGRALTMFEDRLMLRVPDARVKPMAIRLIRRSRQHFGTYLYDKFQHATNGYAM